MEELQIFEGTMTESCLEMLCWEEDLNDKQKAAYEAQIKSAQKFKKIQATPQLLKKRTASCEFWRKKVKPRIVVNNNIHRIQGPNGNTTYSLVVASSASAVPLSQSVVPGRLMNSAVTSVSSLQSRPQITAIRAPQQLGSTASVPPSVAQPMSVIHRNSLQQQQPLQNVQMRATSLPMQPLQQHVLYDSNSGIFFVPSSQAQAPQQVAVRSPIVRQSTPVSSFITRPTTASAMIASRTVNPNQITNIVVNQQQQFNQATRQVFTTTPTSVQSRPATTTTTVTPSPKQNLSGPRPGWSGGMVPSQQSFGQNTQVVSAVYSQPTTSPAVNGPSQQNQNSINKIGSKTPVTVNNKVGDAGGTSTVVNGNSDTNNNSGATGNTKTFPSLVVNVKPCLHEKPSKLEATNARTELDQKVKQILMYAPTKFSEWLMQQGLVRLDHFCDIHKTKGNEPVKFVLGMFNDKDNVLPSGGFIWISDCCPGRQISVFEGSIFDSPSNTPSTLLKLMYHWACQTSASNVLNWCKVTGSYLKNFYTLLRSVCVAALHEFCPTMGGPGKFIEVGIITLGTTLSAPSGKKHVKIEILGVFDPSSKIIRMKLVNPSSNTTNLSEGPKNRGVQILSPINLWVEKSSTVVIDGNIEQSLLLDMGFKQIIRCQSSAENETPLSGNTQPTNINVMKYLRHVVPKMFQATLCVLSKSLIQQFLDELSWREKWGRTSKDTFDNILNHIVAMTKWEFGAEKNLVAWLNKVSMNPFQDWSYTRQYSARSGIDLLPDSIRQTDMPSLQQYERSPKVNSNGITLSNFNRSAGSKPPLLLPQVPMLTINGPTKRKMVDSTDSGGLNLAEYFVKHQKTIALESYYYAELPGIMKQTTGEFPQLVKCPLCSKPFYSNLDVYRHIFSHVNVIGRAPSPLHFCNYCLKEFQPSAMGTHVQEHHKMIKIDGFACRICTEKFTHESQFVIHMWENHCAADTPYKCEICDYQTSFHHQAIDHYNETHKGCDSVLCPLCLKVLSAKSYICLKQITVHIQNHQMRKGKKCPHCVLVFFGDGEYRTHLMEGAHKERTNQSRKTIYFNPEDKGLLMAKPPKIVRPSVPPSLNKKIKVSADGPKKFMGGLSRVSVSGVANQYNTHEHNLNFHGVQQKRCIECEVSMTRPEHYPGHMSCIKCRFSTCCKTAMDAHLASSHPTSGVGKSLPSIKVKEMPMMEKPLLCACQFQTIDPNRLARHLALCDKTTAFPLDWEEQKKKRAGLPPPEPLSILDHLVLMRNKAGE